MGGVAAGSIGLGGRGDLRDWEIFNRPNQGHAPDYGFVSIWAKRDRSDAVARVLEAKLAPPYASGFGLGPANAPGLIRLDSATFEGEFPFARIDFHDAELPVEVKLEAFSPFFPLDAEESGLPVATLRYRVHNPAPVAAECAICFSLDNPAGGAKQRGPEQQAGTDGRVNTFRDEASLKGILFSTETLAKTDPMWGTFAVGTLTSSDDRLTYLRGWPLVKWWTSPLLFWDDFKTDGELGPEWEQRKPIGSLCLKKRLAPRASADFTFVLAWNFPNRTPAWCGWTAPKGEENTNLGNHYATRFGDAWEAASYAAANLARLEKRTRQFVSAVRESTIPAAVKDAAMSNLSTLVTQTCFRTSDGEFHGFEGSGDDRGCCFGNCTHVWNYETATAHLFPSLARSLRKHAFGYSQDEQGGMRFRQLLPDGKQRFGYAAADGQMGQILHAYLDWQMSGDTPWLRELWPKIRKALEFCWIPGGWDSTRRGVFDGVQHNTYDVEFYGPNPLCGVYYLGGLRAAEQMAMALGEVAAARDYGALFDSGRQWIDANLFNGEYYIQKIRSIPKSEIAPATVGDMGSEDSTKPQFQLGDGCLLDQLIGQYLADLTGLGDLLNTANLRKTLESIHRYNYKPTLKHHESVQRIYALNDEAATVVCDYGRGKRPEIPFPYFAEAWTGQEYLAASLLIFHGFIDEGIACVEAARARYDGAKRNPWDEVECGHHYARAMSSWSLVPAVSGFHYEAALGRLTAIPRVITRPFRCFWSTANAWGMFTENGPSGKFEIEAIAGDLQCSTLEITARPGHVHARHHGGAVDCTQQTHDGRTILTFTDRVILREGEGLEITSSALK